MTAELVTLYDGKQFKEARQAFNLLYQKLDTGRKEVFRDVLKRQLLRYLKKTATIVATRNSRGYPGGTSDSSLSRRSGRGFQSIHDSVKVRDKGGAGINGVEGLIGGIGYLRTHEFGAVITPKRAKYLTIPLPAALNANGTPIMRSARQWTGTFIIRSKAGNLLIVRSLGRNRIEPLYVLKKSVRIKPRLGMSLTLDQYAGQFMQETLKEIRQEFFGAKA